MNFKGIVLAGGKSSRFGEDKALAKLDGVTLLEHAVGLLREVGLEVCVITHELRDYSFLDCAIERDLIPGKGPLGGLYTACKLFRDGFLVVLTCDMPFLTKEALQILVKSHREKNRVTLLHNPQKEKQPFPGIYESGLAEQIFERILQDKVSMAAFLETVQRIKVIRSGFDARIFFNINERKDIERATNLF